MEVSCAFPTALDSPDNIALAERMGYDRAWVYDTPQQSPDVWMTLALAAERTERIGLGPGVLVPSLRHPMVNAAATATLAALAPGRVAISFGTGFSGRRAMGYRAIPWSFMKDYLRAYRGLLRGEVVEWEGARMQMLHPDGHAPARPVDVPILVGALGPKGDEVARELGRRPLRHPAAPGVRQRLLVGAVPGVGHRARRRRGHRLRPRPGGGRARLGAGLPRRLRVRRPRRRPQSPRWRRVDGRRRAHARGPAPPRRARRALRRAERGRPGGVGRGWSRDAPGRDPQRHARRDPRPDRRARRARRHRDRVPAVRARRARASSNGSWPPQPKGTTA